MLGELVAEAERRASVIQAGPLPDVSDLAKRGAPIDFAAALSKPTVAVIAEIKRRSPSKGSLNESLRAGLRAQQYAAGGASALSVLTEPSRFGGSMEDLAEVRSSVAIPILRKDFIVRAVQLYEARAGGADAVLLIARALEPSRSDELAREANAIGLAVLFEVRDEAELARAIAVPGCAIGVNARNLETLEMDPSVSERLIPLIPPERAAVFESGIDGLAHVERAARLGADAVLVGSMLSRHADGQAAVAGISTVVRVTRG
ncbi:MAG: indole-3-glycerol phosphate synthase TrpC [Gemmatimonadetes bacterium]|nr:indole-3-glycerol phosphate synthase TrpC [Gemmatimonadota bacterium]